MTTCADLSREDLENHVGGWVETGGTPPGAEMSPND